MVPNDLEGLRSILADRYVLERELGRGGMAVVYLARDRKHDRSVALKVLRPELTALIGGERFLREIRITGKLNHPHILPLLDSGDAGGALYYVMPYVEGASLRQRLEQERELPVDEVLQIAREVGDGLEYAHAQGWVHRDIKPENILFQAGHALIADFGIARAVTVEAGERLTETGLSLGTPAYMSPEQVAGDRDIDARSDVYSLACVLYEMLAGQPPFTGPTARAVLARQVTDPVPPLTTLRAGVPAPVVTALARALAKTPADRFASTGAFVDALHAEGAERQTVVKSIVVLPFENLSPDPDNAFFADGLTEEIITDLSQIRSLLVISRNSAMQLKGTSKDTKTIGRELNVRYVLEGTVRRAGTRLRITAQLIDAATDVHLWADKFAGALDDVFDVQESVSRAIVDALQVELSPEEQEKIAEHRPVGSVEAYDLYLLGRHHMNQLNREGLRAAVASFQQAVDRQPDYAIAHAGLADSYMLLTQGSGEPPLENFPKARAAAVRALEIDPALAEAHTSLGGVRLFFDWDFVGAEAALRRAIELNPNYGQAHHWLAISLYGRGRHEDARQPMARALALDPLAPYVNLNAAYLRYGARDYEGALALARGAVQMHPESPGIRTILGLAHLATGRYDDAIGEIETAVSVSGGEFLMALMLLGYALTRVGRVPRARKLLQEMEEMERRRFVNPDYFAIIHIGLGEYERALDRLEQATEARTDWPVWFLVDPMIDPIRTYPRYLALLKRIGLSEWGMPQIPPNRLSAEAASVSDSAQPSATGVDAVDKSIAVLPFENMSPDPENAFFADGLTEELIADLSKVQALKVISRTSAFTLKHTTKTVPTIARELGVRYVLEGSVRRTGKTLRITAQLIDTASDTHLWAEKYGGTLEDVFDLQERLSRRIVEELEVQLSADEHRRLAARPLAHVQAHDIWLQARQSVLTLTMENYRRARELVEEALALVGDNALLHATLGWIHMVYFSAIADDTDGIVELAKHHAGKALALDPDLAWAHFVIGIVHHREGRMQEFIDCLKRALTIERDSHILSVLGIYCAELGKTAEARHYAEEARARDPLSFISAFATATVEVFDGRAADVLDALRIAWQRFAHNEPWSTYELGYVALQADREDEALERFRHVATGDNALYAGLGRLFAAALEGDREAVLDTLGTERVSGLIRRFGFPCVAVAECLVRVGEDERALEWLNAGIGRGAFSHRYLSRHDRLLASMRNDKRFAVLMERAQDKERALIV